MDERRQDHRPITELDEPHRRKESTPHSENANSGKLLGSPIELHAVVSDPFPDFQAALDQASQVAKRIKSLNSDQQRKIKELESDLDIQKRANSTLLSDNQTLNEKLKQLERTLHKLEREHQAARSCVNSLIQERDTMQEDLANAKSVAHKVKSDNHHVQRQLMETQQVNENLRHESSRAKRKMAHTADTISAFKEIINQLEETTESSEEPIAFEKPSSDSFESWLGQKTEHEKQSA